MDNIFDPNVSLETEKPQDVYSIREFKEKFLPREVDIRDFGYPAPDLLLLVNAHRAANAALRALKIDRVYEEFQRLKEWSSQPTVTNTLPVQQFGLRTPAQRTLDAYVARHSK